MREETREFIKDNLVRINQGVQKAKRKVELGWFKETLVKLYLKSPPKVQFALAKYGVKAVLNKKNHDKDQLIKH